MKPLTLTGTLRRLESIEGKVRIRQSARTKPFLTVTQRQIVEVVMDYSLSIEQAAQKIQSLGGRQSEGCVARLRELIDLARQRRAQGWKPA